MRRDDTILDQLMELKALTELTGVIHEAQVFQLKAWAAMVFDNNTEINIGLDPAQVVFKSDIKPDAHTLEGLDRSVKYVLGDYFAMSVIHKDTEIFNSPAIGTKRKYRNE